MFFEILEKLKKGNNLTESEAEACLDSLFKEDLKDEDMAQLLVLLAEKGETKEEIVGFAKTLIRNAAKISLPRNSIDLCGTGGSGKNRFNISTASAFILASGGVNVIKHGNKGSRKPNGSFDFLEAIGCQYNFPVEKIESIFRKTHLCFVFARTFHASMKKMAGPRQIAARRTIFNIIGPLSNPAQPDYQIIGSPDIARAEVIAQALADFNRKCCLVVTGEPGIDEISVSGKTDLFIIKGNDISRKTIKPEDFGIKKTGYDKIPGGEAPDNAKLFYDLIDGKGDPALLDMLCLNAGAAFFCIQKTASIEEGYSLSRKLIKDGEVKKCYENYKKAAEG